MRWERLFADLEGEYDAAAEAELASEVADRTRREVARLRVVDRLRPHRGHRLELAVAGAGRVAGVAVEVGPDWLLVAEGGGRESVVSLDAVLWLRGLSRQAQDPDTVGRVDGRLDLRVALRRLARDRAGGTLVLRDATSLVGTLDRVGADWVDLAVHAQGEPRRAGQVLEVRTVPLAALALVRTS